MASDKSLRSSAQKDALSGNVFPALRSTGILSSSPTSGLIMFLVGGLIVAVLAYLLQTGDALRQWDMTVAKTFRAMQVSAPWSLMEDILFGDFLGREVVLLIGIILAVYFLHQRFWRELAMLCLGLGGGALLWFLLSRMFDRPPPTDHLDILPLAGPSFPSGSAMMAILCYGLLGYLLVPVLGSRFWKWFVALLCVMAVVSNGLSSLLFGIHYATDVIAGYALGLAWAGLIYPLMERMIPATTDSQRKSTSPGLRTPGWFHAHPKVAWALILLASITFAAIGAQVLTGGALTQLDQSVYKQMLTAARMASPLVNDVILFGFFVGKQAARWIALILSVYFLYQRYWLEFGMLQIATQGGGLLKNFIIDYFARPRPPEQLGFVTTALASFPSGHALGTVICYGFLAYLLVPRMPSPFWKWTLGIDILLLVLFEGFSRVFHGNHYLTDVLAAYVLGIAWLVFVCTVLEAVFLERRAQRE